MAAWTSSSFLFSGFLLDFTSLNSCSLYHEMHMSMQYWGKSLQSLCQNTTRLYRENVHSINKTQQLYKQTRHPIHGIQAVVISRTWRGQGLLQSKESWLKLPLWKDRHLTPAKKPEKPNSNPGLTFLGPFADVSRRVKTGRRITARILWFWVCTSASSVGDTLWTDKCFVTLSTDLCL